MSALAMGEPGLQHYHPEDAATAAAPLGRFCGTTGRKCDRSQGACPSVGPSNVATSVTSSAASNGLLRKWSAPSAVACPATSSDPARVAPDVVADRKSTRLNSSH